MHGENLMMCQTVYNSNTTTLYNFALTGPSDSAFSLSFNTLLKIFPLTLLGISSVNLTPPLNFLWLATFFPNHSTISFSSSFDPVPSLGTTYANGTSEARSSLYTPNTATSEILS
jgi:hypothetical protein